MTNWNDAKLVIHDVFQFNIHEHLNLTQNFNFKTVKPWFFHCAKL